MYERMSATFNLSYDQCEGSKPAPRMSHGMGFAECSMGFTADVQKTPRLDMPKLGCAALPASAMHAGVSSY